MRTTLTTRAENETATGAKRSLRFLMYYTWANPVEYCRDPRHPLSSR